jgi:ubiquitin carboxyl-terminal hydrolase 16
VASTCDLLSGSSAEASSSLSSHSADTTVSATNTRPTHRVSTTSSPKEGNADTRSLRSVAASARSTMSRLSQSTKNNHADSPSGKNKTSTSTNGSASNPKISGVQNRRRKPNDRWWRISDDKVKEAKTSEVLGMQREVYMLFYELEREDTAES